MRQRRLLSLDKEGSEESLINLTPLIDVVLVLLIMFILLSPILNVESVDLATGGDLSRKGSSRTPVAIAIRADNSLWVHGQRVEPSRLFALMSEEKKKHPGESPQLIADKNAKFGTYQEVKNILENCGFEQLDILLQ